MTTGYVGTVTNGSLAYTPLSRAKVAVSWSAAAAGNLTINGATAASPGTVANGTIILYCLPSSTLTIGSSSANMTAVIAALEEGT